MPRFLYLHTLCLYNTAEKGEGGSRFSEAAMYTTFRTYVMITQICGKCLDIQVKKTRSVGRSVWSVGWSLTHVSIARTLQSWTCSSMPRPTPRLVRASSCKPFACPVRCSPDRRTKRNKTKTHARTGASYETRRGPKHDEPAATRGD